MCFVWNLCSCKSLAFTTYTKVYLVTRVQSVMTLYCHVTGGLTSKESDVILGSTWNSTRWILTLSDEQRAQRLTKHDLDIGGVKVRCRRYDDVVDEVFL
jgi:hypothetical protein